MKILKFYSVMTLIAVVGLSGCTNYNGIHLHKQSHQSVDMFYPEPPLWKGDEIRYELLSGKKGTMVISSVTSRALIAEDGSEMELADVASLERKDFAKAKTAAAAGAGLSASAIFLVMLISAGLASALIAAG